MIPDKLQFVIRAAVRSVKHFCQEALLPIIGREHGLCCAQIVENQNTAVSSHPPQMKMFIPEEGILINIPGAYAPFLFVSIYFNR